MALRISVPLNVSAITISGVALVPNANSHVNIANAPDVAALCKDEAKPRIVSENASTGALTLKFPAPISSITIGGNVYAPDGSGVVANIPAAIATAFLTGGVGGKPNNPFSFVGN